MDIYIVTKNGLFSKICKTYEDAFQYCRTRLFCMNELEKNPHCDVWTENMFSGCRIEKFTI